MPRTQTHMANKQQLTGMRGVFLVAAEMTRLGFIVSPTSRSAVGADLLATDQLCKRSYSVQVKTNKRTHSFWLLSKKTKDQVSRTHIYVLVNLIAQGEHEQVEYFVVPSKTMAEKMVYTKTKNATWYSIQRHEIERYRDRWSAFGSP